MGVGVGPLRLVCKARCVNGRPSIPALAHNRNRASLPRCASRRTPATHLSQHRARHCCSLLLRLLLGLVTHLSKHLSRTVCKWRSTSSMGAGNS